MTSGILRITPEGHANLRQKNSAKMNRFHNFLPNGDKFILEFEKLNK